MKMRIEEIRSSLADVCIRTTFSGYSIYRFVNRIFFMFQIPVCFCFCRMTASEFELLDWKAVADPFYLTAFSNALAKLGFNMDSQSPRSSRGSIKEYAIPLFKTRYHILGFRIILSSDEPLRPRHASYEPVAAKSDLGSFITSCFSPFGQNLREIGIDRHLAATFDQSFPRSEARRADHDEPGKLPFDEHNDFYFRFRKTLFDLINSEMKRFEKSPILSSGDSPPNFIASIKIFDRKNTRFDEYYYNIYYILTDLQKKSIVDFFRGASRDSFTAFHDRAVDNWFWNNISDGSFESLFLLLDKPLSPGVRMFNDGAIITGISTVTPEPFTQGNVGWLDERYVAAQAFPQRERREGLRFLATLHYFLQAMAPTIRDPILLTLPIRVAGASWITVSTVRSRSSDRNPELVDSNEFQIRFRFYHSLIRELEGRLQRKSKELFIDSVGRVFTDKVRSYIGTPQRRERHVERTSDEDILKLAEDDFVDMVDDLQLLCRFYPYATAFFGPKNAIKDLPDYQGKVIGDACDIAFFMDQMNPFFDRLSLREFLNPDSMRERLRRTIYAELGLRNWRPLRVVS